MFCGGAASVRYESGGPEDKAVNGCPTHRSGAMAARFDGQIFTFTQPDGTPIQLRGWGDQYYAVFETLDGYTVAKNPATGYWEVARLAPDGNALQPAAAPGARLDGSRAGVPKGLRVRRESAMAAAYRRVRQARTTRLGDLS